MGEYESIFKSNNVFVKSSVPRGRLSLNKVNIDIRNKIPNYSFYDDSKNKILIDEWVKKQESDNNGYNENLSIGLCINLINDNFSKEINEQTYAKLHARYEELKNLCEEKLKKSYKIAFTRRRKNEKSALTAMKKISSEHLELLDIIKESTYNFQNLPDNYRNIKWKVLIHNLSSFKLRKNIENKMENNKSFKDYKFKQRESWIKSLKRLKLKELADILGNLNQEMQCVVSNDKNTRLLKFKEIKLLYNGILNKCIALFSEPKWVKDYTLREIYRQVTADYVFFMENKVDIVGSHNYESNFKCSNQGESFNGIKWEYLNGYIRKEVLNITDKEDVKEIGGACNKLKIIDKRFFANKNYCQRRNVAMARLADMLGIGSVVAHARKAKVINHSILQPGVLMESAKGKMAFDSYEKEDQILAPKAHRKLIDLQLLDTLTHNWDRHNQNYFVTTSDNKNIEDIQGIDNDMSFSRKGKKKLHIAIENKIYDYRYIMKHNRRLPAFCDNNYNPYLDYIDKDLAYKIIHLDKETIKLSLGDLLKNNEIETLCIQLNQLKAAIYNGMAKKGNFLRKKDQFQEIDTKTLDPLKEDYLNRIHSGHETSLYRRYLNDLLESGHSRRRKLFIKATFLLKQIRNTYSINNIIKKIFRNEEIVPVKDSAKQEHKFYVKKLFLRMLKSFMEKLQSKDVKHRMKRHISNILKKKYSSNIQQFIGKIDEKLIELDGPNE